MREVSELSDDTGLPQTLRAKLRLRELILDGGLRGGERLSEQPLAARLGVSRTPLRLALGQLEHEGLLEAVPGGGFAVSTFTLQQVEDAIDLRGLLEGMAARLAAERLEDAAELEAMHGCVAQLDALVRPDRPAIEAFERYVKLNARFHLLLSKLAKSRALETAIAQVEALPFASASAFVLAQAELPESHRILYVAQVQHRGILESIEYGEGSRAEALCREHARLARRNLDVALTSERALDQLPGASLIVLEGGEA
ncbi:MAG TPA: GntR family transcriptional regulator [Thermoleophilaceae bacterium]|jgi:GntR family transcriptional regulator of vanillate catabolism|nr:GntR family transcriptional regulator [Thermoleophilaceae bacterium]